MCKGSNGDDCTCAPQEKGVLFCCRSVTLSDQLPWVSDRCTALEGFFLWISSGTLDRISRPMIPRAVPCWPGWRLPFVSKPLLTSSSYCHVVSWGSCHGEQSPSLQTTTGLITGTICTPGRITEKSFPEGMFIVMVAEINLILTNIYSKGGSLYSQLVKQDSSSLSWLF